MRKFYSELTDSEKIAFATDTVTILRDDNCVRHSRLGFEISVETFDQIHRWYHLSYRPLQKKTL